jgi:hypothetical protein
MYLFDTENALNPSLGDYVEGYTATDGLGDYVEGMGDYVEGFGNGCSDDCDDCEDCDNSPNGLSGMGTWWQDLLQAGTKVITQITAPKTPTFPTYPYTPPYTEPYPAPYQQTTTSPMMDWLPWIVGGGAALYLLTRR